MMQPKHINKEELALKEDTNATKIELTKIEEPIKNATIDIIPGKKVKVNGKDGVFSISQKLNNGKVSVLGTEGLILMVKPEELRDVK